MKGNGARKPLGREAVILIKFCFLNQFIRLSLYLFIKLELSTSLRETSSKWGGKRKTIFNQEEPDRCCLLFPEDDNEQLNIKKEGEKPAFFQYFFPIDIIEMTDRSFLNGNLDGCKANRGYSYNTETSLRASDCFIVYTAGAGVKQHYSWEIVISCVNHGDRLFSLSNNASRKILPLEIPISSIIIGDTLMDFHWLEATAATTKNVFCLPIIYAMLTSCFYILGWVFSFIVSYFRLRLGNNKQLKMSWDNVRWSESAPTLAPTTDAAAAGNLFRILLETTMAILGPLSCTTF